MDVKLQNKKRNTSSIDWFNVGMVVLIAASIMVTLIGSIGFITVWQRSLNFPVELLIIIVMTLTNVIFIFAYTLNSQRLSDSKNKYDIAMLEGDDDTDLNRVVEEVENYASELITTRNTSEPTS